MFATSPEWTQRIGRPRSAAPGDLAGPAADRREGEELGDESGDGQGVGLGVTHDSCNQYRPDDSFWGLCRARGSGHPQL